MKASLLFISLFFVFGTLRAETRHIHVIKMLDDNSTNPVISDGCRSIDYGIDQELQLMKLYLGITDIHYYHVSGTNFSRARLQEVIDYELSYQERDIIVVVYAGHGYREPHSQSRYPKLYFNNYAESMEFEDLRWQLIQKNPSMLINMVIACNVTQLDHSVPPPYLEDGTPPPIASLTPKSVRRAEPYLRMFADQPGYTKVVDFVSADVGKYTFMTRDGGIFFNEILFSFQELFTDGTINNWAQVCRIVSDRTIHRSNQRLMAQTPYCDYNIVLSSLLDPEPVYVDARACRQAAKGLRKTQRQQLKYLRRSHREQIRNLPRGDREQRQLLVLRQRSERASLKVNQEQNYQRQLALCR